MIRIPSIFWLLLLAVLSTGGTNVFGQARRQAGVPTEDQAVKLLSEMIDRGEVEGDKLVNAYRQRASLYAQQSEYGRAMQDFTSAIELDPDLGQAYSLRGYLRGLCGMHKAAMADHAKAEELAEKNRWKHYKAWVLQHKADTLRRQRKFDQAISVCNDALKDSNYATVWFRRAWIYLDMGEWDKAAADFERFKLEAKRQNHSMALFWPDERIAIQRLTKLTIPANVTDLPK